MRELMTLISEKIFHLKIRVQSHIAYLSDWANLSPSNDLLAGICATHVWGTLGWHDIRQRYRRSVLGPLWFTISTLIYVGAMGVIYSTILDQKVEDYNSYLGIGLISWQFISTCISETCVGFIGAAGLIKQMRMPLTVHVARIVYRNLIILAHNLPIFMVLIFFLGNLHSLNILFLVVALMLLSLTMVFVGVILAMLCARFRDVAPIVSNIIQVSFFITPIMFEPKLLKGYKWVSDINPFYHLIEIVRAPILGHEFVLTTWFCTIAVTSVSAAGAFYLLKNYRNRVVYWI